MRGDLLKLALARVGADARRKSSVWKAVACRLEHGAFSCFETTDPETTFFQCPLSSCSVALVPFEAQERICCFSVISADVVVTLCAPTVSVMFDWACALYLGSAIANGGGFMITMEKALKFATNEHRGSYGALENLTLLASEEVLTTSYNET